MAFAIVWFEFEPTIHLFRIFGEIFPQIFYPRPDWILAIRLTQLIFRFILYWWLILELVRIFMAGATFYCSVAQVAHRIIAIIDELTNRYGPCARQIQNYRVFRIIMTILNDMSNLAGFLTCFGLIIICCSSNYMIIANFSLFPVWLLLIFMYVSAVCTFFNCIGGSHLGDFSWKSEKLLKKFGNIKREIEGRKYLVRIVRSVRIANFSIQLPGFPLYDLTRAKKSSSVEWTWEGSLNLLLTFR